MQSKYTRVRPGEGRHGTVWCAVAQHLALDLNLEADVYLQPCAHHWATQRAQGSVALGQGGWLAGMIVLAAGGGGLGSGPRFRSGIGPFWFPLGVRPASAVFSTRIFVDPGGLPLLDQILELLPRPVGK